MRGIVRGLLFFPIWLTLMLFGVGAMGLIWMLIGLDPALLADMANNRAW